MKFNLIGPLIGNSGYNIHFRNFFNTLANLEEVKLETQLIQGWEAFVNDTELKAIKQPYFKDGITYCVGLHNTWHIFMLESCEKFIGCCVWEGDRIPLGFVKDINVTDLVVVPSSHVKNAILNTIPDIENKIKIVPHGVNLLDFQPRDKTDLKFTFLANKGFAQGKNDRGGLYYLLKAYCEEFKKNENVVLKIKINMSYCPPGYNVFNVLESFGLPKDHADILINTDFVDYKDIPKFYDGDVFVSPTMGEAFSIPCLEAMASGIMVITTGFGGQTDFVNNDNGILISWKLKEVTHDVLYEGINWAEPDVEDLKKKMRWCFEHSELVKEKGIKARKMAENYSWRNAVDKFFEILK